MASTQAFESVIGASVNSTVGAAFKLLEARIQQLKQLSDKSKADLYTLGQSLGLNSVQLDRPPGELAGAVSHAGGEGTTPPVEVRLGAERGDAQGSTALLKRIAGHVQVISFTVADIARGLSRPRVSLVSVKVGGQRPTASPAGVAAQAGTDVRPPVAGTPSSVWGKASDAFDGAMQGIDDAVRPVTDRLAVGITHIANGFTALSDNARLAVVGAAAAGATLVTLKTRLNAFTLAKGLLEAGPGKGQSGGEGAGGNAAPAPQPGAETRPPASGEASSVWGDASDAFDQATQGIDDAMQPATDGLAVGITHVAKGFTALSDNAKLAVLGAAAAGASLVTMKTRLNAFKLGKGLLEIGRDLQGGESGEEAAGEKTGGSVLETALNVVDAFGEAIGDGDGDEKDSTEPQKVFVVNAQDFCCGETTAGSGRRGKKKGGGKRRSSSSRPPSPSPSPPPSPAPTGGWAKIKGYLGKAGAGIKSVRAPAALEAVYKVGKTYLTAETAEQKAEGYGGAVGGLGGALAGAALGSFVPVIGSAIGAVIGGIAGSEWGASLAKKWFASDDADKPSAPGPTHLSKSMGEVARSMNPGAGEPITLLSLPPAPPPNGPAPQPVSQQITFAPHMPITVQGSVSDPAQLALNIEPIVRRQFDEMTRMAANRQLADPTFV